jgi:hypothetical protein
MKLKIMMAFILSLALLLASCATADDDPGALNGDNPGQSASDGKKDTPKEDGKEPEDLPANQGSEKGTAALDTYARMLAGISVDSMDDVQFDMDFNLNIEAKGGGETVSERLRGNIRFIPSGDIPMFAVSVSLGSAGYIEVIFDGSSLYADIDGDVTVLSQDEIAYLLSEMDIEDLADMFMEEFMAGFEAGFNDAVGGMGDFGSLTDLSELENMLYELAGALEEMGFDEEFFAALDALGVLEQMISVDVSSAGGGEKATLTVDGKILTVFLADTLAQVMGVYGEEFDVDLTFSDIVVSFATDGSGNPQSGGFSMGFGGTVDGESGSFRLAFDFRFNAFGSGVVISAP